MTEISLTARTKAKLTFFYFLIKRRTISYTSGTISDSDKLPFPMDTKRKEKIVFIVTLLALKKGVGIWVPNTGYLANRYISM